MIGSRIATYPEAVSQEMHFSYKYLESMVGSRIATYLERIRTRVFASSEGFPMSELVPNLTYYIESLQIIHLAVVYSFSLRQVDGCEHC